MKFSPKYSWQIKCIAILSKFSPINWMYFVWNFKHIRDCTRLFAQPVMENHIHFINKSWKIVSFFTIKVMESHGKWNKNLVATLIYLDIIFNSFLLLWKWKILILGFAWGGNPGWHYYGWFCWTVDCYK